VDALRRIQALNAAYETLSDSSRRNAYDRERNSTRNRLRSTGLTKVERNLAKDVHLRLEDFVRGTTLEVTVNDPAVPSGREVLQLTIPPGTAPGTRFRVPRTDSMGGMVTVRVRALPGFHFKVRGSDLRCDLKIPLARATQGGVEWIRGLNGEQLKVTIPRGVERGEIIRIPGEGLPKPRGGRGDLLVRITYRPEVRIGRQTSR
jgi:curved DNA-binding protein